MAVANLTVIPSLIPQATQQTVAQAILELLFGPPNPGLGITNSWTH